MEILVSNRFTNLNAIINKTAKFQKVLLLYDSCISSLEINSLYACIKDLCIFNKMNLNSVDKKEIFNGYKVLIFYCNANSLKNFDIDRSEFINIYIPSTTHLLPFFSNNFNLLTNNSYILIETACLDTTLLSSLYFNNFFKYAHSLLYLNTEETEANVCIQEINIVNIINTFNSFNYLNFLDLEIANNIDLEGKEMPTLHLILINAFLTFITAIKQNQYSVVDMYKVSKGVNYELIDRCYSILFNDSFYNSILLNYNYLYQACLNTKNKIIKLISTISSTDRINEIILNTKEYLKNHNCKLNYLYFFNLFGN